MEQRGAFLSINGVFYMAAVIALLMYLIFILPASKRIGYGNIYQLINYIQQLMSFFNIS